MSLVDCVKRRASKIDHTGAKRQKFSLGYEPEEDPKEPKTSKESKEPKTATVGKRTVRKNVSLAVKTIRGSGRHFSLQKVPDHSTPFPRKSSVKENSMDVSQKFPPRVGIRSMSYDEESSLVTSGTDILNDVSNTEAYDIMSLADAVCNHEDSIVADFESTLRLDSSGENGRRKVRAIRRRQTGSKETVTSTAAVFTSSTFAAKSTAATVNVKATAATTTISESKVSLTQIPQHVTSKKFTMEAAVPAAMTKDKATAATAPAGSSRINKLSSRSDHSSVTDSTAKIGLSLPSTSSKPEKFVRETKPKAVMGVKAKSTMKPSKVKPKKEAKIEQNSKTGTEHAGNHDLTIVKGATCKNVEVNQQQNKPPYGNFQTAPENNVKRLAEDKEAVIKKISKTTGQADEGKPENLNAVKEDNQRKIEEAAEEERCRKEMKIAEEKRRREEVQESCFKGYEVDIVKNCLEYENQCIVPPCFMAAQKDAKPSNRHILLDWLVQVQEHEQLSDTTYHIAVEILDLYLSKATELKLENLQLIGATALLLGSKYEDRNPSKISRLVYLTANSYTEAEIKAMERELLTLIDKVPSVTVMNYLPTLLKTVKVCRKCHALQDALAHYLVDLSTLHVRFSSILPSVKATAAVALAVTLVENQKQTLHSIAEASPNKKKTEATGKLNCDSPSPYRLAQDSNSTAALKDKQQPTDSKAASAAFSQVVTRSRSVQGLCSRTGMLLLSKMVTGSTPEARIIICSMEQKEIVECMQAMLTILKEVPNSELKGVYSKYTGLSRFRVADKPCVTAAYELANLQS